MKKAIMFLAVFGLFAVPALAEETKKSNSVKLPIPGQAAQEVSFMQCQQEKATWYAVAEAYRVQLVKLGWDCKFKDNGIICSVEQNVEGGK